MKAFYKLFIAALAAVAALVSCSKEIASDKSDSRGGNPVEAGKITVNVEALMGELTPAEETKAGIAPVIRLAWAEKDSVFAYCRDSYLGKLGITPKVEGTSAVLSGIITAPKGQAITLVYSNVDFEDADNDGALTFDFSNQDGKVENPFVAYGTLSCDSQTTTVTNQSVPFTFATSLMRIAVTGLDEAAIDSVRIKGLNSSFRLMMEENSEPEVSAATSAGTIVKKGIAVGDIQDERAIFNVSVVKTDAEDSENTNRKITVYQGIKRYGAAFTKGSIDLGKSYISIYALKETDGSRGKIGDHDYVYIAGTRWATQNLTISESGNMKWKGGNTDGNPEVKVPGTDSAVIVGDYFQWAAYENYALPAADLDNGKTDKGLLIYTSFTNTHCVDGGSEDKFEFKSPETGKAYQFNTSWSEDSTSVGISPYFDGSKGEYGEYTKYTGTDDAILDSSDDVAHIILGENWRMPTKEEFQALYDATFWAWSVEDEGYYVFIPDDSHAAGTSVNPIPDGLNKEDALLFFPATGGGSGGSMSNVGTGTYWSSNLYPYTDVDYAHCLSIRPLNNIDPQNRVNPQSSSTRCLGRPIRPVSD